MWWAPWPRLLTDVWVPAEWGLVDTGTRRRRATRATELQQRNQRGQDQERSSRARCNRGSERSPRAGAQPLGGGKSEGVLWLCAAVGAIAKFTMLRTWDSAQTGEGLLKIFDARLDRIV